MRRAGHAAPRTAGRLSRLHDQRVASRQQVEREFLCSAEGGEGEQGEKGEFLAIVSHEQKGGDHVRFSGCLGEDDARRVPEGRPCVAGVAAAASRPRQWGSVPLHADIRLQRARHVHNSPREMWRVDNT